MTRLGRDASKVFYNGATPVQPQTQTRAAFTNQTG
jgi:hypothetical protein